MTMTRRSMLGFTALGSAALALAACTTTKNGTVTTRTLNVAKINSYAKAGLNAAATVASILTFVPVLSVYAAPVRDIAIALQKDLNAFTVATDGKVSIVYDDANWKTIIDSLLGNLNQLLLVVKSVADTNLAGQIGSTDTIVSKVNLVRDALGTVVSIFDTLVAGFISTASNSSVKMTEADALAALGQ